MNPTSSSIEQQRGKYVPWVIAAFFVSFIVPLFGFVWIAFTHMPSEVTSNAYQKGLSYNQTLEKAAAQKTLGWKGEITLTGSTLRFLLKDAHNQPISGAKIDGWLVRPSEQALDRSVTLKETEKGLYQAEVELPAKGLWDARITALSQDKQFQTTNTLTVR
jgi:nitrogen fixation protein FixH